MESRTAPPADVADARELGVTLADVRRAAEVIQGQADGTPLVPSASCPDLWLKLETCQPMGAFKLRGALNAVAGIGAAGVTCCSTGNHGRALAWAARATGKRAVICMSTLVPQVKIDGIRALGGEVVIAGESQDAAQVDSSRIAREEGLAEVPPFDDPAVIAGQGTIALEMLAARPELECLLVPLSGGGLAAGVALAAKAMKPGIRVIGISMERGAAMAASLQAGHPVEVTEVASLADSLGGGIGLQNRWSFAMCQALLDDVVLLSEAEIARGMQALYFDDRLVAEGAGAVGVAALLAGKVSVRGPMATIVTGRNVDMEQFTRVITGQDVTLGDLTVKGVLHGA